MDSGLRVVPPPVTTPGPVLRGGRLRAVLRIVAVGFWTGGLSLIWVLGNLPLLLFPRSRVRWRQWVVRHWARGVGWVIGMRTRVGGVPPAPPFFLVSNHLSYVDIILLLSQLDCVFIAKREMRGWPVLGPLAHIYGSIWVNRAVRRDAVRVLDLIDEAVARGDGVVLFAEGTTSAGDGLLPMKPALFDWAAREQYPVHYAVLRYSTAPETVPAHLAICWWGEMPFGPHAWNLCRMGRFEATVEFGPQPITAPTRGELAERVQEAISKRFIPVVSPDALQR